MNYLVIEFIFLLGFLAALFGILFCHLAPKRSRTDAELVWLARLSPAKYKPMERLLREDDYHFLVAQPGFSRAKVRAWQAQRRHLFREYLRWLRSDFGRVYRIAGSGSV